MIIYKNHILLDEIAFKSCKCWNFARRSLASPLSKHKLSINTQIHSKYDDFDNLTTQFARFMNEREAAGCMQSRGYLDGPSPLQPPTVVITTVLQALQRLDWPETNSGIVSAFRFTKPWRDEAGAVPPGACRRRSWAAMEQYVDLTIFGPLLKALPYSVLLECDEWKFIGGIVFPSLRNEDTCVQAIQITQHGIHKKEEERTTFTFTFCMEREKTGPFKDCWLVAGVRQGVYSI